jgi:hypothetical protein
VEQWDGKYWVLKDKFRTGLSPHEKVKLGKEPMGLFMEDGIKELAKVPIEEIDANKLSKDDVDVRLKWLGLFHRRKRQCTSLLLCARAMLLPNCLLLIMPPSRTLAGISDEETPVLCFATLFLAYVFAIVD